MRAQVRCALILASLCCLISCMSVVAFAQTTVSRAAKAIANETLRAAAMASNA